MKKLTNKPTFISYPPYNLTLAVNALCNKQEGDLGYIYAPFRNLQSTKEEDKGRLIDLRTTALNFHLTNPVDIQVQPSYDGTVNLLLNDDLNPPRLINSRFTVTEDKRFKIIDRKGDNDTNIYSEDNVDLQTRLFKNYNKIPYLKFLGLQEGGNLKTGSYSFYFKYTDADGNESDIIAESGVICVHEGAVNDPSSISGGVLNTNCNKIIKLQVNNLDTSYDYLNIYYTRETGEDSYVSLKEYVKILDKKIINSSDLEITITGFENILEINSDLLNVDYNIVDRVKSQAQVQNMLFFANIDKPTIPYNEFEDLSLRILPSISAENNIGFLNTSYRSTDGNEENIEYYNMKNVYKYTGYWNSEIYRFGVVYILKDDTLSPVFNIRGCDNLNEETSFQSPPLFTNESKRTRNYITLNEDGFYEAGTNPLENIKGVVRLNAHSNILKTTNGVDGLYPLAINFNIDDEVLTEIKKYAKGMFFVRQKRIPTILGQGLTIGVDSESGIPCLKNAQGFVTESFLDESRKLSNNFDRHLLINDDRGLIKFRGILSPELTVNKLLTNGLFNNSEFILSNSILDNTDLIINNQYNNFKIASYENKMPFYNLYKYKLISVPDSSPLKVIDNVRFSAIAGMAEEAFRFKWFGVKDKTTNTRNIIRGQYCSYLGCNGELPDHKILNIHIPGYSLNLTKDYFKIRFNSLNSYFAISDRYDFNLINDNIYDNLKVTGPKYTFTEYRGDCFINTVTVRMQRNFVDPEVPLNDEILDYNTWAKNYLAPDDQNDKKDNSKINRGDINAVQIGHWVTFKVMSNMNLALRSLDESEASEQALLGKPRGFYPVQSMSTRSESKMPESELYNAGYKTTTSDKEYVSLPDVPYIKNIFDNRVMFSSKHVNDAFQNGYRVFQGLSYQDVTRQYGAIIKIFNWQDSLLTVFENGVAILPINERALIQTEAGQSVHMYGAGVLPDKESPVSVDYGSRWPDSIIRTPLGIYGVDTEAKKIWRFSQNGFEIISDLKIGKFLNENLIYDSADYKPIVGLRNVKTHYDNFKGDVIFTFYDCTRDNNIEFNLVYNERINKWITRTDWTPLLSENINNIFISFDKDVAKQVALNAYTLKDTNTSEGIVLDSNIIKNGNSLIGTLSLKGYDYYKDYNKQYIILDGTDFTISEDKLNYSGNESFNFKIIQLQVILSKVENGQVVNAPPFTDYLYIRKNDVSFDRQYLFKHGQANLFANDEQGKILPTNWYNKQHGFEFEFIVNDKFYLQKIFDNLKIVSNKAEPESITVWVEGDGYDFENNGVETFQPIKDITKVGRLRGNAHYKENIWDIEIKPFMSPKKKQTRLRDKYAKVRVRYSGKDLAIITLIQTFYTISYA